MPKIPDCNRCKFYAHSRYLICAVHPSGTAGYTCPDFSPDPEYRHQRLKNLLSLQRQTAELLSLLYTHPILTGKCPVCGIEMEHEHHATIHWDCECGWIDDSI